MRCSASVVIGGVVLGATLGVAVPPVGAQSQDLPPPPADVLACSPRLASLVAPSAGRLVGAPDNPVKRLFRQADTVLIDVGASSDLAIGTQFFLRRRVSVTDPGIRQLGFQAEVTTGWVRIIQVNEHASLAVIERTCESVQRDDSLAPFQWPGAVTPMAPGAANYDEPATVLFGPDGRALSGTGQLLVIDQGADRDLAVGQRVTVFRFSSAGLDAPVTEVGEGVAVLTEATWATIHLSRTREPVKSGDKVAIQRP
jgi:hypothetical protein